MSREKWGKVLAAVVLVGLLAGCQNEKAATEAGMTDVAVTENTTAETTTAETTTTTAEMADSQETAAVEEINTDPSNITVTTQEIISNMRIGWNLGNTMDATGMEETAWGNPYTTQEMIDAVAGAGFNTVRIPVTWYTHMDGNDQIDEKWLARVKEVIDYCMANDMYVIINTHHETSWLIPDEAHYEAVEKQYKTMWKQIANYYRDYDEHLIFEGLNEPRVEGGENEWNGGTKEGRDVVNRLLQVFVDTVRATGGNNSNRTLLVTTFAASATEQAVADLVVPEDANIGVSIHAYAPYHFTFCTNEAAELFQWDGTQKKGLEDIFALLDQYFLSKGIPVIMTEFGAQVKVLEEMGDVNLEDRIAWVQDYVSIATEHGIPCIWWDNGYFTNGNEFFGLLNRRNCEWFEPELVEAMVKATESK